MDSYSDREKLIGALAAAMGHSNFAETKYDEAHYDSATGTLYCNGYIISGTTIDEALGFFRDMKEKVDKVAETDSTARNVGLYYQTAIEAIIMMQKSSINGKVIVKNRGDL